MGGKKVCAYAYVCVGEWVGEREGETKRTRQRASEGGS